MPNTPAANVPYYTPAQIPPAGSFVTDKSLIGTTLAAASPAGPPTLFTPLRIRGVTLHNRLAVSPMCMYSARDGHLSDFHLVHLGQFALHGAGLTMVEASAVEPRGRISPWDSGIWADSHVPQLRRIADFIRSQGHASAIQLSHAGRKASVLAPWLVASAPSGVSAAAAADEPAGGWPDNVVSPSAIPFAQGYARPRALTVAEIDSVVDMFAAAARRAVAAGFDVVEIHGAHGYLLNQFLSPLSNHRTDEYGGSFENRTRLLFRVVGAVRAVIPESMPLFLRLSATERMEHAHPGPEESFCLDTTIRIARLLYAQGVDLLDVSSGGNNSNQRTPANARHQIDLAAQIRASIKAEPGDAARLLISAVGSVATAAAAAHVVQDTDQKPPDADLVFAARQFLRDPAFALNVANELGVPVKWPTQYLRALPRRQ